MKKRRRHLGGFLPDGKGDGFYPADELDVFMSDQAGGGFFADRGGGLSPITIFGSRLEVWHRADSIQGSDLSGAEIVTWRDQSGKGRNLSQATSARRLSLVSSAINGKPAADPGTAGDDRFMSWTPWAAPANCTLYAVVKFVSKVSAYQILAYAPGTNFTGPYLGGNPTQDRPMVFTNANTAEWGAALVNGTSYLIKFGWIDASDTCTTRVNAGTEVSQVAGINFTGSQFTTLGFDPAVVSTQDLFSPVGELWVVSGGVSAAQDLAVHAYVRGFWGPIF